MPVDSAGIYFDQVPLRVRVQPYAGYRFVRWDGADVSDPTSKEIDLILSENATLEAVFEPENELMITEIYYLSPANPGAEFIELYNPKHSTTIDLAEYTITGDIVITFPAGSYIKPMSYLVIAADTSLFSSTLNIHQWESGHLDDSSGVLVLRNNQGDLMDSVHYLANSPWPESAENESIQCIDYLLDNAIGSNWEVSSYPEGTPGRPIISDQVQYLVINEVQSFNEDFIADEYNEYNDWIEIFNTGSESIDIGGLFFTNRFDIPDMYQVPANAPELTTIGPGEYKIFWADRDTGQGPLHLSFNLNKGGSIAGISVDGKTYIDYTDTLVVIDPNLSYGRYPNGGNDWRMFDSPTPGKYNSLPPEILSTPLLLVESKTQYEYGIEVTDPENDELIVGVFQLPDWLNFLPDEHLPLISGRSPISRFDPQRVVLFVTDGYTKPVTQSFEISRWLPDAYFATRGPDHVTVYPNPASDIIHILAQTNSADTQLSIVNLSGQVLWNETVNNTDGYLDIQVDLSDFRKGLYLLRINTEEEISVHKILLQ